MPAISPGEGSPKAGGSFVCDCGTRLRIFTEGKDSSVTPCPNPKCKTRHHVSGQVRDVQLERDRKWVSYESARARISAA